MGRGKRAAILVLVFGLTGAAQAACGDDAETEAPRSDGGAPPFDGGGADATPPASPFGLDRRPPNPTCLAGPRPSSTTAIEVVDAYPNLVGRSSAVGAFQAPGDPSRWYLLTLPGVIVSFPATPNVVDTSPFLTMPAGKVRVVGEGGLLGFAFDPSWATTRTAYLSYTTGPEAEPEKLVSVISRIKSTDGGQTLDPSTEEILLTLDQPFDNHNGGQIAFGPDGYLYVGFGDGGDANDPFDNGQNTQVLLGKMLRLAVGTSGPYTIPADNPFVAGGGRPEIYATGLRNPWRWSFDRATGELWAGDVGQNWWEEIDVIARGGNYGWKIREGTHCRFPTTAPCDGDGSLIDPVFEYEHVGGYGGAGSVSGGYVYRGSAQPDLVGRYFFADYVLGEVYALADDPITGKKTRTTIASGETIVSFAESSDGEIYAVQLGSGHLLHVRKKAASSANPFPNRLSATGCFDPNDPRVPLPALVPYTISAPFYADGAEKSRWLALPDGQTMRAGTDGDIAFPNGAVLAKEFRDGTKRLETRLFVKHDDGTWAGYTYAWNDDETDALLVTGGARRALPNGRAWTYPSASECMQCHTEAAGRSLGLELRQLLRDTPYPSTGRTSPQIATLLHVGMLALDPGTMPPNAPFPTIPEGALPADALPTDARALDRAARSYLHTNCASCHRPNAPGAPLDLRFDTPLATTGACAPPTRGAFGVSDARILAPGAPERSILLRRLTTTEAYRMPPLGRTTIDPTGVALLDAWTRSLAACADP